MTDKIAKPVISDKYQETLNQFVDSYASRTGVCKQTALRDILGDLQAISELFCLDFEKALKESK